MSQLLTMGVVNALLATVLAIVVWLVTRKWRHPVFVHVLWVVVLAKLVTPPLVAIPSPQLAGGWPSLERAATPAISHRVASSAALPEVQYPDTTSPGVDSTYIQSQNARSQRPASTLTLPLPEEARPGDTAPSASSLLNSLLASEQAEPPGDSVAPAAPTAPPLLTDLASRSTPWTYLAGGLWLGGSVLYLALASIRVIRFHRALRGTEPAPASLQQSAQRVAARLGASPSVRVRLTSARLVPLVWPLGRPTILLSQPLVEELSPSELETLLAHELAHLRRKDHWVRWLEMLVTVLYWWHPVVWWARRSIQQAEEHACDAWVVGTFPEAVSQYAAALFKAAQFASEPPQPSISLASRLTPGGNLKERIETIMNASSHRRLSWPHRIVIAMVVLLLLPVSLRAVQKSPQPALAGQTSAAEADSTAKDSVSSPGDSQSVESAHLPSTAPQAATTVRSVAAEAPGDVYQIEPGDLLHVWVLPTPPEAPIQDVFQVEPSGTIALGPMYGRVDIRGATLAEAEARLTELLSQILQAPRVQVTLPLQRLADSLASGTSKALTPREAEIQERLKQPVRPQYHEIPLEEALRHLSDECNVEIYFDPRITNTIGLQPDEPVTLALNKPVSLESALNLILRPLTLTHRIEDEVLKIVLAESDQPAAGSQLVPSPAPPVDTHRLGAESSDITAKLAWAAESMRSPVSLRLLQELLESQQEEKMRLEKLHEEGQASAREVRNAAVELQILLERIRQTERELEQRRLLRDIAQLEVEKAFEANERTAGAISQYELKKLKLQVDLAEARVRAVGE